MGKINFSEITKFCLTCGNKLILTVSRDIERKKFCSRSCAGYYQGKINISNPEIKLKFLNGSNTKEANSKKGLRGELNPKWKKRKIVKCNECSKEFEKIESGKRKYCSFKCFLNHIHKNNKGKNRVEKIDYKCIVCETPFQRSINYRQNPKYCSLKCNGIYQILNSKKKKTDIELIIENLLIDMKIHYIEQARVENISIADFKVENILIFADGDYWHSLPGRPEKDKEQTKKLESLGYNVLRFSGNEIHNKIEYVKEKIKYYAQNK
jgi:very-short-patch-repair endonuclease